MRPSIISVIKSKWIEKKLRSPSPLTRVSYVHEYLSLNIILYGQYEKTELDLFRDFCSSYFPSENTGVNSTIIDVGANIGNHTLYFSKIFKNVISFEPHPLTFRLLELNCTDADNIILENRALGEGVGEIRLAENKKNMGGTHVSDLGKTVAKVTSLDDYLKGRNDNIAAIKIDVEGYEREVLQGAMNTISNFFPIIYFEQRDVDFVDGESLVFNKLKAIGYSTFLIPCRRLNYFGWMSPRPDSPRRALVWSVLSWVLGYSTKLVRIYKLEVGLYKMIIATR